VRPPGAVLMQMRVQRGGGRRHRRGHLGADRVREAFDAAVFKVAREFATGLAQPTAAAGDDAAAAGEAFERDDAKRLLPRRWDDQNACLTHFGSDFAERLRAQKVDLRPEAERFGFLLPKRHLRAFGGFFVADDAEARTQIFA